MEGRCRLGEGQAGIPSGGSITDPALSRFVATERKDCRPTGTGAVEVHAPQGAEAVGLNPYNQPQPQRAQPQQREPADQKGTGTRRRAWPGDAT